MTHAYFIPDQDFVDALRRRRRAWRRRPAAAAAEVQPHRRRLDLPRLLLPAARGRRRGSSGSGTRWCTPRPATIDGSWTTVGTANIDRLSLSGNYEINVEIIDPSLAEELERIFAVDVTNCLELTLAEWEARDLHRRFTELVLRPLRPLL